MIKIVCGDESRLAIPIAEKRLKIFKKTEGEGPDLDHLNDENRTEPGNGTTGKYGLAKTHAWSVVGPLSFFCLPKAYKKGGTDSLLILQP